MIIIKCDRCKETDLVKQGVSVVESDLTNRKGFRILSGPFEIYESCLRELEDFLYPTKGVDAVERALK